MVLAPQTSSLPKWLLKPGRWTVGSATTCHYRVVGVGVQPRHALIVCRGQTVVLKAWDDQTWCNGQAVRGEIHLQAGDQLRLGSVEISVDPAGTTGALELSPQPTSTSPAFFDRDAATIVTATNETSGESLDDFGVCQQIQELQAELSQRVGRRDVGPSDSADVFPQADIAATTSSNESETLLVRNGELERAAEQARQESEDARNELQTAREVLAQLQSTLAEEQQHVVFERQRYGQTVAEFEAQRQQLAIEREQVMRQLTELRTQRDVEQQLVEREQEELLGSLTFLREQVANQQATLAQQAADAEQRLRVEAELRSVKADLETECAQWQSQHQSVANELTGLRAAEEAWHVRSGELEFAVEQARQELDTARAEWAQFQSIVAGEQQRQTEQWLAEQQRWQVDRAELQATLAQQAVDAEQHLQVEAELRSVKADLETECEQWQSQQQSLASELAGLRAAEEALHVRNGELEYAAEQARRELNTARAEFVQFQTTLAEEQRRQTEERLAEQEELLSSLTLLREQVANQQATLVQQAAELEQHLRIEADLQLVKADLETERERWQSQEQSMAEQLTRLRAAEEVLQVRIDERERAADQARQESEQARQAADQARQESEQARQAADQARQESEQARQAADQARQESDQARQVAGQAQQESEQAREESDQARQESQTARAELAQFQTTVAEEQQRQTEQWLAENEHWQAERAELQATLQQQQAEWSREQARLLEEKSQRDVEQQLWEREQEEFLRSLTFLREQVANQQATLAQQAADAEHHLRIEAELRSVKAGLETECAQWQSQHESLANELTGLRATDEARHVRNGELELAAEQARQECDLARQAAEQARQESEQARHESDQARQESAHARNTAENARQESEEARRAADQARQETDQAREELQTAREEFAQFQTTLADEQQRQTEQWRAEQGLWQTDRAELQATLERQQSEWTREQARLLDERSQLVIEREQVTRQLEALQTQRDVEQQLVEREQEEFLSSLTFLREQVANQQATLAQQAADVEQRLRIEAELRSVKADLETECAQWQSQQQAVTDELTGLRAVEEALQVRNGELERAAENARQELQTARAEWSEFQNTLAEEQQRRAEEWLAEKANWLVEQAELQTTLQRQQAEWSGERDEFFSSLTSLRERVANQQATLAQQAADVEQHLRIEAELRSVKATLESECAHWQSQQQSLANELTDLRAAEEALHVRNGELEFAVEQAQQELDTARAEMVQFQTTLADEQRRQTEERLAEKTHWQADQAELQATLQRQQAEWSGERGEFLNSLTFLRQQVANQQATLAQQAAHVEQHLQIENELRSVKADLETERSQWQSQQQAVASELTGLRAAEEALHVRNSELEFAAEQARQELDTARAELVQFQTTLAEEQRRQTEERIAEQEHWQADRAELQATLQRLAAESSCEQAKLLEEKRQLEGEQQLWEREREEFLRSLTFLREQVANLQATSAQQAADVEQHLQIEAALQSVKATLKSECAHWQSQQQSLASELTDLRAAEEALQVRNGELESAAEKTRQELDTARVELVQFQSMLAEEQRRQTEERLAEQEHWQADRAELQATLQRQQGEWSREQTKLLEEKLQLESDQQLWEGEREEFLSSLTFLREQVANLQATSAQQAADVEQHLQIEAELRSVKADLETECVQWQSQQQALADEQQRQTDERLAEQERWQAEQAELQATLQRQQAEWSREQARLLDEKLELKDRWKLAVAIGAEREQELTRQAEQLQSEQQQVVFERQRYEQTVAEFEAQREQLVLEREQVTQQLEELRTERDVEQQVGERERDELLRSLTFLREQVARQEAMLAQQAADAEQQLRIEAELRSVKADLESERAEWQSQQQSVADELTGLRVAEEALQVRNRELERVAEQARKELEASSAEWAEFRNTLAAEQQRQAEERLAEQEQWRADRAELQATLHEEQAEWSREESRLLEEKLQLEDEQQLWKREREEFLSSLTFLREQVANQQATLAQQAADAEQQLRIEAELRSVKAELETDCVQWQAQQQSVAIELAELRLVEESLQVRNGELEFAAEQARQEFDTARAKWAEFQSTLAEEQQRQTEKWIAEREQWQAERAELQVSVQRQQADWSREQDRLLEEKLQRDEEQQLWEREREEFLSSLTVLREQVANQQATLAQQAADAEQHLRIESELETECAQWQSQQQSVANELAGLRVAEEALHVRNRELERVAEQSRQELETARAEWVQFQSTLAEERQRYEQTVAEFEARHQQVGIEREQLVRQLDELQSERDVEQNLWEREGEEFLRSLTLLREQIANQQATLAQQAADAEQHSRIEAELRSVKAELETECARWQSQQQTVANELTAVRAAEEALHVRNGELERAAERARLELDTARAEWAEFQNTSAGEQQRQTEQWLAEQERWQADCAELQATLAQQAVAAEQNLRIEAELRSVKADLEAECAQWQSKQQAVINELNALRAAEEGWHVRKGELEFAAEQARQELETARVELAQFQSMLGEDQQRQADERLAEQERWQADRAELQATLQRQQAEWTSEQARLLEAKLQLEERWQQAVAADAERDQELTRQAEQLQSEQQQVLFERQRYEQAVAEFEAQRQKLVSEREQDAEQRKDEQQLWEWEREEFLSSLTLLREDIANQKVLVTQQAVAIEQHSQIESELRLAKGELEAELALWQSQEHSVAEELARFRAAEEALRVRIGELESLADQARQESEETRQESEQARQELQAARAELAQVQSALAKEQQRQAAEWLAEKEQWQADRADLQATLQLQQTEWSHEQTRLLEEKLQLEDRWQQAVATDASREQELTRLAEQLQSEQQLWEWEREELLSSVTLLREEVANHKAIVTQQAADAEQHPQIETELRSLTEQFETERAQWQSQEQSVVDELTRLREADEALQAIRIGLDSQAAGLDQDRETIEKQRLAVLAESESLASARQTLEAEWLELERARAELETLRFSGGSISNSPRDQVTSSVDLEVESASTTEAWNSTPRTTDAAPPMLNDPWSRDVDPTDPYRDNLAAFSRETPNEIVRKETSLAQSCQADNPASDWPESTASSPSRLSDSDANFSNAGSCSPTSSPRILISGATGEVPDVVFKSSSALASKPLHASGDASDNDKDPASPGASEIGALRSQLSEMFNFTAPKDTPSPIDASVTASTTAQAARVAREEWSTPSDNANEATSSTVRSSSPVPAGPASVAVHDSTDRLSFPEDQDINDSVSSYMQHLLARSRQTQNELESGASNFTGAATTPEVGASVPPSSNSNSLSQAVPSRAAEVPLDRPATSGPAPLSADPVHKLNRDELRAATEKLRDVANLQTLKNVETHSWVLLKASIKTKCCLAGFSFVLSAGLLFLGFRYKPEFIMLGACAICVGVLTWVDLYMAIISRRRLTSKVANRKRATSDTSAASKRPAQ